MSRLVLCWLLALLWSCASPKDSGLAGPVCDGDAAPATIEEMVDHLNSLPPPVTVPCLLDSLARPLEIEATEGVVSAQPADGPESPRIFVFTGNLVTSLVASGPGSEVLEFGEAVGDRHTRKGEVAVPVEQTLAYTDPFTRIEHPDYGTSCAICHIEQTDHPTGGTTSIGIAPESRERISISELRAALEICNTQPSVDRCATLEALFRGPVDHRIFPDSYPTINELTE